MFIFNYYNFYGLFLRLREIKKPLWFMIGGVLVKTQLRRADRCYEKCLIKKNFGFMQ